MTLTLRTATIDDAPLLARLNMTVHQMHVDAQPRRYKPLSPDDPALLLEFARRIAEPTMYTWIAEVNHEPVGYVQCVLRQIPENVYVYSTRDFHIDQLSVNKAHQNQGVGQALMNQVMQTARELEAEVVTLGVAVFNTQAQEFYTRLGFAFSGHSMWLWL